MNASRANAFGRVLPVLLGSAGGFFNALLLWLRIPERVGDFEPVILLCGALHGGVLAACGLAGAGLALRHERLRVPVWIATGYAAGWISWIPAHRLILDKPLVEALFWPFTGDVIWEAVWRPFQYFGLVGLFLAAALTVASATLRRSPLGLRALGVASGIVGSLWFWCMFEGHARMGYVAAIHGVIWGMFVGAGLSLGARRPIPLRANDR